MSQIVQPEAGHEFRLTPSVRPALLSVADAAAYLGIAPSTIYKDYIAKLEVVRLGKRSLITMASLDRLIDEFRSQQSAIEPAARRRGRRARSKSAATIEP
jgi:hypothetical protein